MKRRNSSERERGNKRSREDEIEMRLLIPSSAAGAIIGRGGENIKRLRSEYSATVNVADSTTPERILIIAGDEDNVLRVVKECVKKIEEDSRSNTRGHEARVLVHQSHAGAIIGRGGSEIKALREKTNCSVKVFSECCPLSTERVVQIPGDPENIVDAVGRVLQTCMSTPIKGASQPYDTFNYNPEFASEYGGFGGGGGGMGRPGGGDRGGGMGRGPPRDSGRGFGDQGGFGGGGSRGFGGSGGFGDRMGGSGGFDRMGGGARGFDDRMGGGARGFDDRMGGGGGRDRGPPMGGGGYMGGGGGGRAPPFGGGGDRRGGGGGMQTTTQVTIPDDLAGTVIGKRGARINEIRAECGAQINVDAAEPGSRDRVITITGLPNQIQMAQYLLQQCVRESPAGRRYIQEQQGR